MKRMLFWVAVLVTAAAMALSAEEKTRDFPVKAGQSLEVDLRSGGRITVTGWDREQVQVKVDLREGSEADWGIEMAATAGGVEVRSQAREGRLHSSPSFTFQVPRRFDLKLKTMGGAIDLKDVEGRIAGKTMGGKLELVGLKGELNLETMGGGVTLRDSRVDGAVKTMGGRVLIANVTGDIKGSSLGGNVVYVNVRGKDGKSSGQVVKISTMGGEINVADAPQGADVHTMGGDIRIRSAARFVKAKTMGGDIDLPAVDGRIDATTMGGDIEAVIVGDPGQGDKGTTLTSMGGDITLTVPEKLDMTIEIQLAFTRNGHHEFTVKSDFPVKIETSREWDESHGTPRKTISATGRTGSGRNRIVIKTVNGNVYLKKHQ